MEKTINEREQIDLDIEKPPASEADGRSDISKSDKKEQLKIDIVQASSLEEIKAILIKFIELI